MYISTPKVAILWECFCIAIKCANGDGDFWHILITKKIIKNKFVNVPKISVPIGTLLNNKGGETMVKVELKDGSEIEVNEGASVLEVAKKISEGLARNAMAARIDGEVKDLRTIIEKDCKLEILTFDDLDGKKAYWHTTSHIMSCSLLACPLPVIAIFIFNGAYSVIGISRLKAAAIATPCALPNFNIDCTFFPKKGASIANSSGK